MAQCSREDGKEKVTRPLTDGLPARCDGFAMQTQSKRRAIAAATITTATFLTLSLAACGSDADAAGYPPTGSAQTDRATATAADSPDTADSDSTNVSGEATATQFAACLNGEGVTATVSPMGPVMILTDRAGIGADGSGRVEMRHEPGESSGQSNAIFHTFDESGQWAAPLDETFFAADDPTRAIWAACVASFGGFTQPITDERLTHTDDFFEQMMVDALEFAAAAREAGFYWVADPIDEPSITLPSWITQPELEALLDAVGDHEHTFSWLGEPGITFDWIEIVSFHPAVTPAGVIQQGPRN
jgi:hypothetical protein